MSNHSLHPINKWDIYLAITHLPYAMFVIILQNINKVYFKAL
jgi:hypothetical protein